MKYYDLHVMQSDLLFYLFYLERLIAEEEVELVKAKLETLITCFTEFEASHDAYHGELEDEAEITESENWFEQAQSHYIEKIKAAKDWLSSQIAGGQVLHGRDHDDEAVLTHLTNMLNISKVEIDDGSPLEYQAFISVFDEVVDSKSSDNHVKLTRFLQYTAGPAKAAIKNCALVGGETGYKQARDILKNGLVTHI